MDKKVIVDGLIAKGVWNEADRERLMGMDEDVLKKMIPPAAPETPKQNVQAPAMTVVEKKEDVTSTTAKTLDEYLADMPEAIRSTVKNAMAMEKAEKARLIDIITANKKNTFTAEWLGTQELEMLKNLASLAAVEKDTKPIELGNYGLQLDPVQNVDGVPVLEVPVLKSK